MRGVAPRFSRRFSAEIDRNVEAYAQRKNVTVQEVTAWEIIYAVLHARFLWPLYALLYLCIGMNLKMRGVEYRTRDRLGDSCACSPESGLGSASEKPSCPSRFLYASTRIVWWRNPWLAWKRGPLRTSRSGLVRTLRTTFVPVCRKKVL
jgi:hypothetical protein